MKIDDVLISRLEKLSRLDLPEAEREKLRKDLEKMVDMVGQLARLDPGDEPGTEPATEDLPAWRDDQPSGPMREEEALGNAPEKDPPFFTVPKVIETKKKT